MSCRGRHTFTEPRGKPYWLEHQEIKETRDAQQGRWQYQRALRVAGERSRTSDAFAKALGD